MIKRIIKEKIHSPVGHNLTDTIDFHNSWKCRKEGCNSKVVDKPTEMEEELQTVEPDEKEDHKVEGEKQNTNFSSGCTMVRYFSRSVGR